MADAQKTIDLVFNAVDKTGAAVQSVLNNTKNLSANIQTSTQPFFNASAAALKYEAAIIATGAAITAFSVKAAGDFQSAVLDLQKVLSDTDNIDDFKTAALELSTEYGVAAADVLRSTADFKQAGFTAEEAGILTKSALDLVIAGNVEAATASNGLVAILKGFRAEAAESVTVVDLLNEVSNNYGANVSQLSEGLATLAPIASSAGLSLQETVGILTPGIEVFQSGSEVANSLRTALLRLQDDSKPVQDALEALGVSQKDANGELRSGRDLFFEVAGALAEVEGGQQTFLASQLAGSQRSGQFLAVVNNLDTALRISGDGFRFAGSAAKEVEVQLAGFESTIGRLSANFTNLGISIGTPLLDDFGQVSDAIGAIFSALGQSFDQGELRQITQFIEDEFAGVAETLRGVASALPDALSDADLTGFTDGLDVVRDAIASLFGDLDLTKADDLARAITFVGNAFEGLSQFSAGIIESFGPLVQKIAELAEKATAAGGPLKDLGNVFGIASQINIFAGAITGVASSLEVLLNILIIRQGVGVVGALGSFTTLLSGSSGLLALLGKAGLVGAAGAAGVAIGTLGNKASELTTGRTLSEWLSAAAGEATGLNDNLRRLGEDLTRETGPSADSAAQSIAALDAELASIGNRGNTFNFSTGLSEVTESAERGARNFNDLGVAVEGSIGTLLTYPSDIRPASESLDKLGADGQRLTGTFSVISMSAAAAEQSITSLAGASDELRAKAIIASIEGATEINVAKIEADAERAVAAYQSIDNAISSTGDSITSLFDTLASGDLSRSDEIDLEAQIRKEEQRRQKEFEQQQKLLDIEIAVNKERLKRLRSGESIINIDGAGLQPHLEAFMFEILSAIQVRVNEEGENLLLGLG